MDIYELIEHRKSVRKFKPDMIEKDTLERVMNAARLAPSGSNRQPWKFILVSNSATREKMVPACHSQKFIAEAPLAIVACALPTDRAVGGVLQTSVIDTSIAVMQLMLAATHEGLGTCWIGAFEAEPLKKLLAVPQDVSVVAVVPIGYPVDPSRAVKSRKSFADIICEESYK